jgi:transposase InsO family protein
MDLITQLPRTQLGHDAIVVFVDKLTKMAHYCACTTSIDAPSLATLFFHEVVRHHGLPLAIVSDRDTRFTSIFWRALWSQLGTRLSMSSAYHPQSDGQTERQNRTLEEMIRSYVSARQDDWDRHLDAVEIAYNNSQHASTGATPYYLNSGQHPRLALESALHPHAISNNPTAAERVSQLNTHLSHAKEALTRAQARQARYADEGRREVTLNVGDRVWLSTEHLQLRDPSSQSKKLLSKFIGPYSIVRTVGPVAYELQLPEQLRVHPVFHVSKLKVAREDRAEEFPGRAEVQSAWSRPPAELITEDGTEEYEVESILSKRSRRVGRNGTRLEYLVKWRGYASWEATWEPASHLTHARQAVEAFEAEAAPSEVVVEVGRPE